MLVSFCPIILFCSFQAGVPYFHRRSWKVMGRCGREVWASERHATQTLSESQPHYFVMFSTIIHWTKSWLRLYNYVTDCLFQLIGHVKRQPWLVLIKNQFVMPDCLKTHQCAEHGCVRLSMSAQSTFSLPELKKHVPPEWIVTWRYIVWYFVGAGCWPGGDACVCGVNVWGERTGSAIWK